MKNQEFVVSFSEIYHLGDYADGYNDGVADIACRTLTSYENNEITHIGGYAFSLCEQQKTIKADNVIKVDLNAFNGCSTLSSCSFASLEEIGSNAFIGCAFSELDLPKLRNVSTRAFLNCANLKKLILRGESVVTLSSQVFQSTPIDDGIGFIFVPDNLLDKYKADSKWSEYASQIRPISELT